MPLKIEPFLPFFAKYRDAFVLSLFCQMMVLLFALAELNGSFLFKLLLVAAAAYWIFIIIVMLRRNLHATTGDLFLMKWGYPLAIVLTIFLLKLALACVSPHILKYL
jgi:hypothetical protein